MRKVFITSIVAVIVSQLTNAQQAATVATRDTIHLDAATVSAQMWKYSPKLSEKDLYDYTRLRNMSRDDWDAFRLDPRYDARKVREVYKKYRGEIVPYYETEGPKMMPGEDCQCWIEPDVTYIILDPVTAWDYCEGGAQEGVDCFHQLDLPFIFCFYGQSYNTVFITTKGTIAFGGGYYDWTPSEFPIPGTGTEPEYNHVCGYWQDFDFNNSGQFFYKITPDALYVNFIDVGYYNGNADKRNTFQMIITANDAGILGDGNNVQFCYLDMDWAHGDVGGQSGCTGPTPGNVGADKIGGPDHIQFGRFNLCNSTQYNGPYGTNNNQIDGIDWLDDKSFEFNACEYGANIPPIPTTPTPCDTMYVCINDTIDISTQFIAPEVGQNVTITVEEDGDGLEYGSQNGNTASFSGLFIGTEDNVGVNYVTVTATDNGNPAEEVVYEYVILVQNIVMPSLYINGPDSVCAGGTVEAEAAPGFDSYIWSISNCSPSQYCEFQVPGGGNDYTYSVTGIISGCDTWASTEVAIDPFNYVPFSYEPDTLCPGQCATACVLNPENYVAYDWHVYEDYEGTMCDMSTVNDICTTMEAGTYEVFATTPANCLEFNIFVIPEAATVIPLANDTISGAYCDGLEPVVFSGAFQSPSDGTLTVYLTTGDPDGWLGSYLEINITPCDTSLATQSYIAYNEGAISIYYFPISYCDDISIEYISAGVNDQYNSVYIFNCSNGGQTVIGPGLNPGIIWNEISGCLANPFVGGTWTVDGPPGWSFTDDSQYNTTFTPNAFGLYHLCFDEPNCTGEHCYDLEFTLMPELNLLGDPYVGLCEGQTEEVCVTVYDAGGTGTLDWDGQGVAPQNEECVIFGPYNDYEDFEANVELENGCGDTTIYILVNADIALPPISLPDDDFVCGGEVITLDPVSAADDDTHLIYEWSGPGIDGLTTPTVEISSNGTNTYSVEVSNDCDEDGDAVIYTIIQAANPQFESPEYVLECTEGEVELCTDIPTGYQMTWSPGGATTECITVDESGTWNWSITDIYDCNTVTDGQSVVNITYAPEAGSSNAALNVLCPGECTEFDASAMYADSYTWTSDCAGLNITGGANVNFCYDQVPADCIFDEVEVIGTASNECGSVSESFFIQNNQCLITIPNIFTPGGADTLNTKFEIEGLELYEGAKITIFDRWGGEVYHSDNYGTNNEWWRAEDVAEGTFYYILRLPYGIKREFEGYVMVIK